MRADADGSERRVRVLFAHNPPDAFDDCLHFPTMRPTLKCPFPGWCVEILTYLVTDYLRMNIEPVIYNANIGEVKWGTYINGKWDGVLGLIANGTVDTACLFYQRTGLRAKYFSYSYPLINVKPIYVVHSRSTDLSSGMWNAFSPYANSTWLMMCLMLLTQTTWCIFIAYVEVKLGRRQLFRPYQIVWKFIRLQLYQPDRFDFVTKAGNFTVLVFTIMQCRLLLDMYQTLLLSALLQSSSKNPFADVKDMIKMIADHSYHLITNYKGNWYFEELQNSNVSHYRSLRLATIENPVHVTSSVSSALDKVEAGGHIFPIQQDSLAMQLAMRRCNLVFVSEGLPEMSSHFVFAHDNVAIRRKLDEAIVMNMDFIRRTFNKYFSEGFKISDNVPKCDSNRNSSAFDHHHQSGIRLESLGIVSMFGVVVVMIIGLTLSCIAFGLELYYMWQLRMFQLRLRTRRAMAKPIHLIALARLFAGPDVQERLDEQFQRPTIRELQAHFGEPYI